MKFKEEDKDPLKNRRLMKLNIFIAKPKVLIFICCGVTLLIILFGNYILNFLDNLKYLFIDGEHSSQYIGLTALLSFKKKFIWTYTALLLFSLLMDGFLVYRIRVAYAEMNVGQKGDDRETTLEEIKAQYKEIPYKDKTFEGRGGFIVSEYEDKIYIDDGPVNNLLIGTTRSGKGEMFMFPMIDIYSRAMEKSSLIITAPKLEEYLASKETLEKRGFDVYVLNFIQPELSTIQFNPLQIITESYQRGEFSEAELLCNSFCYSVFNPEESDADSQFWANNSSNLLSALILGTVIDCLAADKKENTTENQKKINMYSVINMFQEMASKFLEDSDDSLLDRYFKDRPQGDLAKMKYAAVGLAGAKTKGSIFSNLLAKLTVFTYIEIAKLTAQSTINLEDIGFGEKPIAIFIGLPDYDRSKDFIANVFIRQLYFVLVKKATLSKEKRCKREVVFLLDELGNMPPIENLANIVTVCLSRGLKFNLVFQSLNQGKNLYKEAWDTIFENCANKMYIISGKESTAEEFSKMCGSRTITNTHRSGKKLSLNKHITEMYEEKRLISANQLLRLKEGECVLVRTTKRQDKKGGKVVPHAIFNLCENGRAFRYRHEYLLDVFPDGNTLEQYVDKDIMKQIRPQERVYIPEILEQYMKIENIHLDKHRPCYALKQWKYIEIALGNYMEKDEIEKAAKSPIIDFERFLQMTLAREVGAPEVVKAIQVLINQG